MKIKLLDALSSFRRWLQRNGLMEVAVLMSLLLVIGSAWLFVEIADEVNEGGTERFDEFVLRALRHTDDQARPIGPLWMAEVARDVTALGGVAILTLISLAVLGFLALEKRWGAFWLVVVSILGGTVLISGLKIVFDRERPALVPHLVEVSSMSFPSGHSMLSAVTYLTLGALLARTTASRRLKIYFISIAAVLALLVGLTRIYLGVHFPTDVLAGWCAGIMWALLCSLVARWLQRKGAVEKESPEQPTT